PSPLFSFSTPRPPPPSTLFPYTTLFRSVKPQPLPPPGGLVLTIYDRPLGRGEKGQYRLPEGDDFGGFRTHAPHGQRSSLWLKAEDRKSTRLNSSHVSISYAVFCLKKKKR